MRMFLYSLGLALSLPALADSLDPTAIMREVRDRDEGADRRSAVTLVQTMADGFVRERQLLMLEKEYGEERKSTLYFTAPSDTAGTGILMHSYAESAAREDDQWLYLPALRKTRRIATNSKEGPFLGTDFSFADIERMRVDDYQYQLLREETYKDRPVQVIEATTADGLENPRTGYSRRLVYVDRERGLILRDEFYRGGRQIKTFEVLEVAQIEGFWTVKESLMSNLLEGGSTRLVRADADYNLDLADQNFSERALRNGIR
ncbi:outer membrane lipoprotein-sorting protein [Aquipseudomonas campi]|uniref:Outer membrane lipoprotein-sorting protein n=1 Tax=Aquipseudomonas campi TaxID=2731681 RepID=A0A6M8FCZ9_9GAMM|nr:outer membrane lipoprotein-sorting protein [Pseudomonas campi]QKE61970.1 outer membrane lipoprotein-sorting protein [Pseudomonas campi]